MFLRIYTKNLFKIVREESVMLTAIIRVSIREGVLDPQGSVTTATLKRMGIQTVKNVSFGRLIKIVFDTDDKKNAESQVVEMCEKLLVNPVLWFLAFHVVDSPFETLDDIFYLFSVTAKLFFRIVVIGFQGKAFQISDTAFQVVKGHVHFSTDCQCRQPPWQIFVPISS